jgi:hypothetical protein
MATSELLVRAPFVVLIERKPVARGGVFDRPVDRYEPTASRASSWRASCSRACEVFLQADFRVKVGVVQMPILPA